jgi:two-component system, response regulator / RNA-binding antiterminator
MRVLIVEDTEQLAAALREAGCADYVVMRAEHLEALQAELADVKLKLEERKLVERAKGLLMKSRGLDEESAYSALRKMAMDRNLRLGEVARRVLEAADVLGA